MLKSVLSDSVKRGLKNVSFLVSSQIITQIISFVGITFIARKLGVENYGIYTTVITYVGFFTLLNLSGSYKVIIREGSKDIKSLQSIIERLVGVKNIFAMFSIAATVISIFFIDFYSTQIKFYVALFSLTHLHNIYSAFFNTIFQATQQMRYISYINIFVSFFYTSIAAIAVYLGYDVLSLLIINMLVNGVSLIVGYKISKKIVWFKLFRRPQWDRKLLVPSLLFTVLTFLTVLQTKIDFLMISWMGSIEEVGLYAVAFKLTIYFESVRNQISTAFYPIIVKRFQKGPVRMSYLLKISGILTMLVVIFCIAFSAISTDIVVLLFGQEFQKAGIILGILIFNVGFRFLNLPFSSSLLSTDNEKYVIFYETLGATLNVTLNYFLYPAYGLIGVAYATLITSTIRTFSEIAICLALLKSQKKIY